MPEGTPNAKVSWPIAALSPEVSVVRDSTAQFEAIFNSSIEAVEIAHFGRQVLCNPAFRELFGYTPNDMLAGTEVLDRFAPNERERVRAYGSLRDQGGPAPKSYEARGLRKDGTEFELELHASTYHFNGQQYTLAIFRDVTERKRSESALRESEAKFRALAEHSLVGIYLIQDGKFKYVNPKLCEIMGYCEQDLLTSIRPIDTVLPEDRPLVERNLARRISGEQQSICYELRLLRLDGEVRNGEVFGTRTIYQGRPAVLGSMIDITARKRAEQALAESEIRLRAIIETEPECVKLLSAEGIVLEMNGAGLAMVEADSPKDVIGKSVYPLVSEEWREPFRRLVERVFGGFAERLEFEIVGQKGAHRWLDTHAVPLRAPGGGPVASLLAVTRDVSERNRAEEALRQSEQRYRAFIEQSSEGISRCELEEPISLEASSEEQIDAFYRVAYLAECNDAMARMYGFEKAEQLTGARIRDLLPPSDPRSIEYLRKFADAGCRAVSLKSYERDKNGQTRIFLNNLVGVVQDNKLVRVWGTQRDVTELEKTQEALRESEDRFRGAFQNSPVGIVLVTPKGAFLKVNPAVCRMMGYSESEMLAKDVASLTHPDDLPITWKTLNELVAGEVASFTIEKRYIHKDGHLLWGLLSCAAIRDAQGNIVHLVAQVQDITERKRAEQERAHALSLLRATLDSTADGILVTDKDRQIVAYNSKLLEMLSIPREAAESGRASRLRPFANALLKDPTGFEERLAEVYRNPAEESVDILDLVDGRVFERHARPHLLNNTQIGLVWTYRDITERVHAERERLALERKMLETQKLESLGVLAGGIAHDFNNLLATILGNVSLASMQLGTESSVRPYLNSIEVTTHRAAELCKQMLAYSGKGRFVVQSVNVNALVQEMGDLLKISIGKDIALKFTLPAGLPAVPADATQIRQVIMNLIINASEAIGDNHGAINLATGLCRISKDQARPEAPELPDGDYLSLEVSDSGCGMDDGTRARIFDPFFTTKFTGRGLGLAAVLGIIRGHKGSITVESTPGHGTTFRVLLPCAPIISGAAAGLGRVILSVSDESRRVLEARVLEVAGWTAVLSNSPHHCLELLRTHRDEIVAAVVEMEPPADEPGLCRELLSLRPGLRLVLLRPPHAQPLGDDLREQVRVLQAHPSGSGLLEALR
ncbi:MAG TPA: PAS domain S-box protein [Planctomycetota bacterium]|jgi:PAS domain S-box-containing protein